MRRLRVMVSLLAVAVLLSAAVMTAPVSATNGIEDDIARPVSAESADDDAGQDMPDDSDGRVRTNGSDRVAVSDDEVSTIRDRARMRLAENRKGKAVRTAEQRQKSCQVRQVNITKKLDKFSGHAEKHINTFNNIFERVQTFHDNKKLDAADYDALVTAAEAKQHAAQEAVAALDTVVTEFDCAAEDPAATVAAVKEAVTDTKTALKEYRTAIKAVIRSLSATTEARGDDGAKAEDTANTTTDGGTN